MEFKYLPDSHIQKEEDDFLNFKEASRLILKAIRSSKPPFTWGIYGDWGSGKTSLMTLIKNRMEEELLNPTNTPSNPLLIPVWFDAWRYENEVNIIYPLFHRIRRDFFERCPEDKNNKDFLDSFKKVATASLFGLTDLALRTATKAAFGEALKLGDVKDSLTMVENELDPIFDKWTDQITEIRKAFESFVKEYVDTYRKRKLASHDGEIYLAIFIDDLDRCLPDVAIEILERIKNHLISERCIFILGINRSIVYKSIRKKYGDLDIDGRQHLEKIVQNSVGVPQPSEKDIIRFGIESLNKLVASPGHYNPSEYFEAFSKTLYETGFTNPRKIKRIMNHYLDFIRAHVVANKDIDRFHLPTVTRLIILREYYQDFYDLFREADFKSFNSIAAYDGSDKARTDFLNKFGKKWEFLVPRFDRMKKIAKMEPGLNKQDYEYRQAIDELFGLED